LVAAVDTILESFFSNNFRDSTAYGQEEEERERE